MPSPLVIPFSCLQGSHLLGPYVRSGSARLIAPLGEWVSDGKPILLADVLASLDGRTTPLWEITRLLQDQEAHFGGLGKDADKAAKLFRGLRHWMCSEVERRLPAFETVTGSIVPFPGVLSKIRSFKVSIKKQAAPHWAPQNKVGYNPIGYWKTFYKLDQLEPSQDACVALLCALEDAVRQNHAEFDYQIKRAGQGLGVARQANVIKRLATWGQPKPCEPSASQQQGESLVMHSS